MPHRECKLGAGRPQKIKCSSEGPQLVQSAICWNPGHRLQLDMPAFSSDKHFGPFNWLSYFSQDCLQSRFVCIHCYTNCADIASVTRDITIKSTPALLRQTGWLKALLFHRPTVTEITLSASFPYIFSTFNDQRTEIRVRDISHMGKSGLSISGRRVKSRQI